MRSLALIAAAAAATVRGIVLQLGVYALSDAPARAVVFGVGIVGAAFLLSWSAEVLQLDMSRGLALGLLALIAVLPEYIVDAAFAWKAAKDPALYEAGWPCQVAIRSLPLNLKSVSVTVGR
jgi:cation:H+ antiporter